MRKMVNFEDGGEKSCRKMDGKVDFPAKMEKIQGSRKGEEGW